MAIQMLHKINRPNCGNKLTHILNLEYLILSFACKPYASSHPTMEIFKREFNENGEWLFKKLWTNDKGVNQESDFFKNLIFFIEYVKSNAGEGTKVLEAFKNDTNYHEHLNDAKFKFIYASLNEATKQAIKPLMLSICSFFERGIKLSIKGEVITISRDILVTAFYEANPGLEVCPACDGPDPEKIGDKAYADADHFFPKSRYPFLSIHPENIIPVCLYCNQRFKLNKDPLETSIDSPLINSFHPYGRCAIDKIDIIIINENASERRICIRDQEGMPSRRISSLNRVFRLEERWNNQIRRIVRRTEDELRGAASRIIRYKREPLNEDDFEVELNEMLAEKKRKIRQEAYSIIYISYLNFVLTDENEFRSYFEKFCACQASGMLDYVSFTE